MGIATILGNTLILIYLLLRRGEHYFAFLLSRMYCGEHAHSQRHNDPQGIHSLPGALSVGCKPEYTSEILEKPPCLTWWPESWLIQLVLKTFELTGQQKDDFLTLKSPSSLSPFKSPSSNKNIIYWTVSRATAIDKLIDSKPYISNNW